MAVFNIREVKLEDLNRCYEIETQAYAGEEAASLKKIAKRIDTYPQGFIVAEMDDEIIGFINSGSCHKVLLSDEDFKEFIGHDETGENSVIMSVVVHPDFQRQGYAKALMEEFIFRMQKLHKKTIHLICQTHLIEFYHQHGFQYMCESASDHGGLSWHEMVLNL
jgi:ribosomal protein S18 acetylase RimI-like enzyme